MFSKSDKEANSSKSLGLIRAAKEVKSVREVVGINER